MKKIIKIIHQYQEIITYIIFGILTTIISLSTYYLLIKTVLNPFNPLELEIANIISWITSVTFAYITNRIYVFNSKNKNIIKEMIKFYISRLTVLLIDMILMYIFVSLLHYNNLTVKISIQIIIIISNYILSKLIIFNNKGSNTND